MLVLEPLLDLVQTLKLTAERGERFSLEIKKNWSQEDLVNWKMRFIKVLFTSFFSTRI